MNRIPWAQELDTIDRLMRAVSSISDPEEMVSTYWSGIPRLITAENFIALSRRGVAPPEYLITRSSRFTEDLNPWTQRDRLPRLSGGILGEIAYADKPVVIDDLPSRLSPGDPAHFYLQGFRSLVALPQYDNGVALNVSMSLFLPGEEIDHSIIPMMHWQASLFGRGTQNLVLRNQLQKALNDLDKELQVVGEIQRSLLPAALPEIPGFDLAAHYQTSARAGGDYYDFFPLDNGSWGIFIADVSGHGTPAAVLMAITHAIAHSRPGAPTPPRDVLAYLNTHLTRSYTSAGTFVTALYAILDPAARTLTCATAGHNPPRLRRHGRIISLDEPRGLPLGIDLDETYAEAAITLEPDDFLLLYTDGITEAMAPAAPGSRSRELFGVDRLDRLLLDHPRASPHDTIEHIRGAITAFTRNTPATDDRTLIALLKGATTRPKGAW